ncbi:hypothetical protein RSSM_05565 [Rhodopirellula sallentina SM41]|uniref:Uncharacterized protein n=1 Tax=Rhodopirellula sallentina SM41 TaxID=1263870 RepID=M5U575_9BACT|nr:hypothetical protein RSSM_05565 [Rhodopirellula sallentina SM41]
MQSLEALPKDQVRHLVITLEISGEHRCPTRGYLAGITCSEH